MLTKSGLVRRFFIFLLMAVIAGLTFAFSSAMWGTGWMNFDASTKTLGANLSLWYPASNPAVNLPGLLYSLYRPLTEVSFRLFFSGNFWKSLFTLEFWNGLTASSTAFINYLTIIAMLLVLVAFAIEIVILIVRAITHRKFSIVLNIITFGAVSVIFLYLIGLIHLNIFGPIQSTTLTANSFVWNSNSGLFANYLAVTLMRKQASAGAYLNFGALTANGLSGIQVFGAWTMLVMFWAFLLFFVISMILGIAYYFGVGSYLRAHKYDYINKLEYKERIKMFKQGRAQNENMLPPALAYNGDGVSQIMLPPSGGNNVSTGNNAPLIVQYFSNGQPVNGCGLNERREEPKPLTKDDLRVTLYELLDENGDELVYRDENNNEYEVMTYDQLDEMIKKASKEEPKEAKPLTAEEVKEIVAAQMASQKVEEIKQEEAKEEEVIPAAPVVDEAPSKEEKEDRITEDELRNLVKVEILDALKEIKFESEVVETREVIKKVEPPQPAPAPAKVEEPKPAPAPVAPAPKPAPAPVMVAPAPVVEEAPAPQPQRARRQPPAPKEIRGKEALLEKVETDTRSFAEKVVDGDAEIRAAYNEIKNLLMSYGLKSRISRSGDTFRLNKVTYAKVTTGGSQLKVYLKLDPARYLNSAIPVGDSSKKEAYKDIPLVFRFKSDVSVRRARDLVNDMMRENNMPQGEEGKVDYVKELKKLNK